MTENFLFKAVFISLAAHTAFLCVFYLHKVNDPHYKALRETQVEITYKPIHKKMADIREYPIKMAQHLDLSNNQKFFSDGTIPVSLVKNQPMLPFGMLYERKPEHMQTMELSRKVSIKPIISEKINDPVLDTYAEIVRSNVEEKVNEIFKKVYGNSDNTDVGTVYLTFLINNHGMLLAVQVIPEKTNASERLQEIAIESFKESSPYPAFLKGMNLSEYSNNIEIDFQGGN